MSCSAMRILRRLTLLALAVLPTFAFAQGEVPEELSARSAIYRDIMRKIVADYEEKTTQLPKLYARQVQALAEKLRDEGDLEGFLAADKESKRFASAMEGERDPFELTPEMPRSALVAAPASLRALQDAYLKHFQDAAAERQKAVADRTAQYLATLRALTTDLTKKNRIDEALAVKREADRIQKALDSGTLVAEAVSEGATSGGGTPPAAIPDAPPAAPETPVYGRTGPWVNWKYKSVENFAQDGMLVGHPDIPDELDGDFDLRRWRGSVKGRCRIDHAVVDMFERSWMGKAFQWRVLDPSHLKATIELESRELSAGQESGPHARLALLGPDRKVLEAVSIPLMSPSATLRIAYDKERNRCALNWQQGKVTRFADLPSKGPYFILLGFCVKNAGEQCDTTFYFK